MLSGYLFLPLILGLITASTAAPVEETENNLSEAACNFTIELLRTATEEGEDNVVTSPVSIGAVLATLQQGAKGATAEQMEKVLGLSPEKSKEAFSMLAAFLKNSERNVTLEWANGMYVREDFPLDDEYKTAAEENFRSVIERRNFTHPSTQETADIINKWISGATHGQINDLLQPSMITVDTVMILVNAIYFKGVWASKFEHARTRVADFHLNAENTTRASYMRQEEKLPAGEDSTLGIKWVELPYEDEKFSMLFLLPNDKDGLHKVIQSMTSADLKRLIANTKTRHVNLGVPKFNLKWKSSLVDLLTKMGLSDLFSSKADLAGISPSNQALTVSEIVHQANVEVDEDGTVASGATLGFAQVLSLVVYEDELIFYADHPFLAFIVDKRNGIPLFAAKIGDPTSGKPADNSLSAIIPP